MPTIIPTPMKAIRMKCLECSGGSHKEVRECHLIDCPLYNYRFGKRPEGKKSIIKFSRKDKSKSE